MVKIVKTRIRSEFQPRCELPLRLYLAAVRDALNDALIVDRNSGDFSERQLEAYKGDLLQDRRAQIEGQHLRQALGIEVLVPGEFGVVPGVSEFPADQCEVLELMRRVVDVSLI